jgi:hypothetical protein
LDWEGNMVEKKHRTQILLPVVEENEIMAASIQVSSIESRASINRALEISEDEEEMVKPCHNTVPRATDEISSVLVSVSPILDDMAMYERDYQRGWNWESFTRRLALQTPQARSTS